jgi:CubicO group peptidase (beta-lactamase class C family)
VRGGEYDGVRLLKPETAKLMRTNRLTDAQRKIPFLGMDQWWRGQGFGLGVSTILDPANHMMSVGREGAFGWPGIYGTWWQADPSEDMILIYWVQNSAMLGGAAAAVAGQGVNPNAAAARLAQPIFQRQAYAAIQKAG